LKRKPKEIFTVFKKENPKNNQKQKKMLCPFLRQMKLPMMLGTTTPLISSNIHAQKGYHAKKIRKAEANMKRHDN